MGAGRGKQQQLPAAFRPPVFARTKFLAPQPGDTLVRRMALVERLRDADALPLTIVVGSPGCGKTSLLTDWYHHGDDGRLAWLAADRSDDDPVRFWRGFIRAAQQVEPTFGVEAADLITLDGLVSADVLESLLTDDARLDERVRIVLDDFHLVSLVAAQQLQHLLERGLHHLRLVIGSRSDPAVGLPRLRMQQAVCEVRERDLRLDLVETRTLVANIGLDPDAVDVQALLDRTEGWAAGVQMAALSVIGTDDPAARVLELAGTTQTIAGYLTSEVMANQSDRVREFLENTCVVDEVDAAMCQALGDSGGSTGVEGDRVTLEQVEAAHLLLNRVDAAGTLFRYHPLFAEMLRHRLHAASPDRYREQHRRAAEQYMRVGDINDAVRHYWQAGRAAEGAQLLRDHLVSVYLGTGEPPPVDLTIIPDDDELRESPADAVGYGVSLALNGHTQLAASLMRRAAAAMRTDTTAHLDRVHITGARIAIELATGNTGVAVDLTREFVALIDGHDLSHDAWVTASIPSAIRASAWEGQLELGADLVGRVRHHLDPRVAGVDVIGAVALLELERGNLVAALEQSRTAHSTALDLGVAGSGPDIAGRAVLGTAYLEIGRLVEAEPELLGVTQTTRLERVPAYVMGVIGIARLLRANGSFESALRLLAETRSRLRGAAPGPTLLARIDLTEIGLRLALGDLDEASDLVEGLPPGFRSDLARGWFEALRRNWSATREIDDRLAAAARTPREQFDLAVLRLRIALDRSVDDEHVAAAAGDVLDLAELTGFVLPIAEAGTSVLSAVAAAAKRRPRTEAVERLLLARPLPRPADQARPQYRVDELSSRELVVLRYMATSMTNQEIAETLFLSVNTVKTHIKHILRKLGATSRAEATRRARDLHYL